MPLERNEHEDDSTSNGHREASNQRSEPPPEVIAVPVPNPPQSPPSYTPAPQKANKWRENTKLGLEIAGLLVLIVYTIFSALQWSQIRWTNRLTREALNDNDSSLKQTLKKMQGQIDQTSRLAGASETANNNAISTDRPWIGGWIQVKDFATGKSPSAICTFQNAGRRPAVVDDANCGIEMDKWNTSLPPDTRKPGKSILLPGQTVIVPIHFFNGGRQPAMDGDKITKYLMDAFDSDTVHIKVIGKISYRDLRTGEKHQTRICMRYLPSAYGNPATFYDCNSDYDAN